MRTIVDLPAALDAEKTAPLRSTSEREQSTVLDAKSTPEALPSDATEAIKLAIRLALDAGDLDRVRALVAVLEASPKPAPVVSLEARRAKR